MKNHILAILFLLSFPFFASAEIKYYSQYFFDCGIDSEHTMDCDGTLPYTQSLARAAAAEKRFTLNFEDNVPDPMRECISTAAYLWGEALKNQVPITVYIDYKDLGISTSFSGSALYFILNNTAVPLALAHQQGLIVGTPLGYDIHLTFNSQLNWNTDTGMVKPNDRRMNALSCALRGIALGLGFGASVDYNSVRDQYTFSAHKPSMFDNLIFSGSTYLSLLAEDTPEFRSFITFDDVYAYSTDNKLYAPATFLPAKSLKFLDNPKSLMHYDFGSGDFFYRIDSSTLDLLHAMGWPDIQSGDAGIYSDNVEAGGVVSAYEPYVFRLAIDNTDNTDYHWELWLTDNDLVPYKEIEYEGSIFRFDGIKNLANYTPNLLKRIGAELRCYYYKNGERLQSAPFGFSIDLKPYVKSISNFNKCVIENNRFYIEFDVEYYGSRSINSGVKSTSGTGTYQVFSEYPLVHIKSSTWPVNSDATFYLYLINEYGSFTKNMLYDSKTQSFSF